MLTNTKINIALAVLIVAVIAFGGFLWVKTGDTPQQTLQEQGIPQGASLQERQAYVDALKKEIMAQIEEKQAQFEKMNAQIVSAQNTCKNISLANVGQQTVNTINKDSFTQTVAGYYTCKAVDAKDISQCNFLRDIDAALYAQCRMNAVNIRIAAEKCSSESITQCSRSGLFSQADCNTICAVYTKNDASACAAAKDPDLYKGCLALTQKNISVCDTASNDLQKAACKNEYYFYSGIQSGSSDALGSMEESFMQSIGRTILNNAVSCESEFAKFINEPDCLQGIVDNYDTVQRDVNALSNEIAELNRRLNEL